MLLDIPYSEFDLSGNNTEESRKNLFREEVKLCKVSQRALSLSVQPMIFYGGNSKKSP